jgi:hypothetical protein
VEAEDMRTSTHGTFREKKFESRVWLWRRGGVFEQVNFLREWNEHSHGRG